MLQFNRIYFAMQNLLHGKVIVHLYWADDGGDDEYGELFYKAFACCTSINHLFMTHPI